MRGTPTEAEMALQRLGWTPEAGAYAWLATRTPDGGVGAWTPVKVLIAPSGQLPQLECKVRFPAHLVNRDGGGDGTEWVPISDLWPLLDPWATM